MITEGVDRAFPGHVIQDRISEKDFLRVDAATEGGIINVAVTATEGGVASRIDLGPDELDDLIEILTDYRSLADCPESFHLMAGVVRMVDSSIPFFPNHWIPVQRCDTCQIFGDDERAAEAYRKRVGGLIWKIESEDVLQFFVQG